MKCDYISELLHKILILFVVFLFLTIISFNSCAIKFIVDEIPVVRIPLPILMQESIVYYDIVLLFVQMFS